MKSDGALDRPPQVNWVNKYFRFGNGSDSRGTLFSNGDEWQEQRRFLIR